MKKLAIIIMTSFLMITIIPVHSTAANVTNANIPATEKTTESIESQKMLSRLNFINNMDKSEMSRAEKRTLRKEVQSIKKHLDGYQGVYISVGAAIIIVLLLILIF